MAVAPAELAIEGGALVDEVVVSPLTYDGLIASILTHPAVLASRAPFCDIVQRVDAACDQGAWLANCGQIAALYEARSERTAP